MKSYLSFENIGMTFRGAAVSEVLRGVNLNIDKGEYVAIIGHSGCGKSTLLNIVAGLINSTVGEVFLDGEVVDAPGPDRAALAETLAEVERVLADLARIEIAIAEMKAALW